MNVEAIKTVRDHIASLPAERFSMVAYVRKGGGRDEREDREHPSFIVHDCETAACIAGWACALLAPEDEHFIGGFKARAYLGLTVDQSDDLFMPNLEWDSITQPQAVAVLDGLLATGDVDWDRAIAKAPAHV